ncbi:uncharacterized protein LOC106706955 [Latimeria chalumnae]|uniref:uncharacterized protein LOC106706955 n=1 Tax=Latimeria chalumnae TaxID=7897 RepID=UPI00313B4BF6
MLLLVAFILFISTVNGKELKVEQKPVCIDAVQGVDVHLYCLFPPLEEKKQYTHWKHNRGDKEKKILKENNKTKLELVAGNSTISLTNVQPEDSGVYYCTVGVTDGEARGNGTTLTVYKYFSDIQSQNKDNTSDFQCVVIGADERGWERTSGVLVPVFVVLLVLLGVSVYICVKKRKFPGAVPKCRTQQHSQRNIQNNNQVAAYTEERLTYMSVEFSGRQQRAELDQTNNSVVYAPVKTKKRLNQPEQSVDHTAMKSKIRSREPESSVIYAPVKIN